MIPKMPGFAHLIVRKGLLVVALLFGLNSVEITGNIQPHPHGMVEFVGLLEPGGYVVSADALLLRIPHKDEEEKIPTDDQIPQQFPQIAPTPTPTSYATLLQASLQSQACNSLPPDSIPCFDASSGQHDPQCEMGRLQNPCLVRLPPGYYHPFSWPSSITKVRAQNIANVQSRRGIQIQGSTIAFKSSATRKYVDKLLPGLQFGKQTRLVLDLEGGVGSLAVELEKHGALTLSIAAPSAALHVILERGYPALVQTLGKNRLPFPSKAFDLVHCGSCSVPWTENGGLLLLEVDRVLQTGGLFVWQYGSGNEEALTAVTNMLLDMCWSLPHRKGRLAIWQKPLNDTCYQLRSQSSEPPFCDPQKISPDDAWGIALQHCIARHSSSTEAQRHEWPARLERGTQRLQQLANFRMATVEVYEADLNYWKMMVDSYLKAFGPSRIGEIRNVLDMNSGYGSFTAAVALATPPLPWWVLNVSPLNERDHLATIFDRGLLGVYHDWCTALNTYPRAFDLVHASRLFSAKHSCPVVLIMLEVDRLLRPGGFAVIRDDNETVLEVKGIAEALHWKTSIQDSDSGPEGKDKLLHCQKTS